ncbi:MAG: DUF366 family protein [Deltaproteobacteria bacterium]
MYIDQNVKYTGEELTSHWIYRNFGILGDAIVAFIGEVNVARDRMIDLSETIDQSYIYSPEMLNLMVEHFDDDLNLAIYRQRLLMICIMEELQQLGIGVTRRGDNLFIHRGKLSISIATATTVSTLIHVGLNIKTGGTPVETAGLADIGVNDIRALGENIMMRYTREIEQIYDARCKVRSV